MSLAMVFLRLNDLDRRPGRRAPWQVRAADLAASLLLFVALACSHGSNGQPVAAPAPLPAITSFSGSSPILGSTSSGLLTWEVTGASSLSIDQGIGTVTGSSMWVQPGATTTYTLTAGNAAGKVTATCTLTVFPADAGTTALLANLSISPLVDGPAAFARFDFIPAVVLDPNGNALIADYGNRAIRMLSPQGQVTTLLWNIPGGGPSAMALSHSGNLYVVVGNSLCRFKPGGVLTTVAGLPDQAGSADGAGSAALFDHPQGLAVDDQENLYVADTGNHTIRLVSPLGQVSTLAGSAGMAGHTDGSGASAQFAHPSGIALAASGALIVVDGGSGALRSITPQGLVSTRATSPAGLPLQDPNALAIAPDGTLFVGGGSSICKISPEGVVSSLAGAEGQQGWTEGPGVSARFSTICGLALDASGNLLVADYQNCAIRAIRPEGQVSTLAGARGIFRNGPVSFGRDTSGNTFLPARDNTVLKLTPTGSVSTYAGVPNKSGFRDGPAGQAVFGAVTSTFVDGSGNVFVTDLLNATIRKISPDGQVTTVAGAAGLPGSQDGMGAQAQFTAPTGIAGDAQGNLYVTDDCTLRRVGPDGQVVTLAGMAGQAGLTDGSGPSARFNHLYGVAADTSGNLFVADPYNDAIRKVTSGGAVTTLKPVLGSEGSAGAAQVGQFIHMPTGVAVDRSGNLYVQDLGRFPPWRITPEGIACQVPVRNSIETMNFTSTACAIDPWGGVLYSASAWGVMSIQVE